MILGLTGGMGCGKTTAVAEFARLGFRRLDSDAMIRDEILPLAGVCAAVRERFGTEVFRADGTIDRARLAGRVFSDPGELQWLEDLVHPLLYARWRVALADAPVAEWVVEVPLLFEKSLENWFDFTVCVASAPAQQLARLEQRGIPRALAEQRISKQLPLAQKIEWADFVLWNDGTPEFLHAQVHRLIDTLPVAR